MDKVFINDFTLHVTDDPTPPKRDDVSVSPLNYPVFTYTETRYEGENKPGHVLLTGAMEGAVLQKVRLIHRTCSKVKDTLFSVSYISDGLFPSGVDRLENFKTLRLINQSMPRTIF